MNITFTLIFYEVENNITSTIEFDDFLNLLIKKNGLEVDALKRKVACDYRIIIRNDDTSIQSSDCELYMKLSKKFDKESVNNQLRQLYYSEFDIKLIQHCIENEYL